MLNIIKHIFKIINLFKNFADNEFNVPSLLIISSVSILQHK